MTEKELKKNKEKTIKLSEIESKNLSDRKIYTLGGEIFSSITHGVTALVGVAVLVLSIIIAVTQKMGALAVVAVTIYGVTAFLGFTISTVYHALRIGGGKRVMRVLDHCSIYFIIAGTYTPFALIAIGGWVGWTIFVINWILCAVGTTLTAVDRERFKKFAFICYLVMGWLAMVAVVPLVKSIGLGASFWLLVGGGLAYTVGAFIFKVKGKYVHGVWHLFTLVGLVLQFLSITYLMLG